MIFKNLFFPPKCFICKKVLPIYQKLPYLCSGCKKSLSSVPTRTCVVCKKPMDAGYDKPFCLYCSKIITGIDWVVAPFPYNDKIRSSILRFKFGNKPSYAKSYAIYLKERLEFYQFSHVFEGIVPVPVSKKRLIKRGYNQSFLMANTLSKLIDIPIYDVLKKTKETPPQSTLSYQKRQENLKNSIEVKENASFPKSLLLVDDVYTTGSTLKVCASMLKKAGAAHICAATFAMHLPEQDEKNEQNITAFLGDLPK